jgi:hypothetical protein
MLRPSHLPLREHHNSLVKSTNCEHLQTRENGVHEKWGWIANLKTQKQITQYWMVRKNRQMEQYYTSFSLCRNCWPFVLRFPTHHSFSCSPLISPFDCHATIPSKYFVVFNFVLFCVFYPSLFYLMRYFLLQLIIPYIEWVPFKFRFVLAFSNRLCCSRQPFFRTFCIICII